MRISGDNYCKRNGIEMFVKRTSEQISEFLLIVTQNMLNQLYEFVPIIRKQRKIANAEYMEKEMWTYIMILIELLKK